MPSHPSQTNEPNPNPNTSLNVVLPDASAQQNTRALLRSLEELRDQLSGRVEQLGNAVERLRDQAGDLERALEGPGPDTGTGTAGSAQGAEVRESRDPTRTRQRAREVVQAYQNRSNPSDPPPATNRSRAAPSAISTEISSLSRPITSEEINSLLDRAAQPVNNRNDHFVAQARTIENRIRRLSETARTLRERATHSLSQGLPPLPSNGAGQGQGDSVTYSRNPVGGLDRLLSRVRDDQERVEVNLRRLDGAGVRSSSNPQHTRQGTSSTAQPLVVGSANETGRERTRLSTRPTPLRPRARGLPPTNTIQVAQQPAPEIVRSTPASPAETVRPAPASPQVEHHPSPLPVTGDIAPTDAPLNSSSGPQDDPLSYRPTAFNDVPRPAPVERNATVASASTSTEAPTIDLFTDQAFNDSLTATLMSRRPRTRTTTTAPADNGLTYRGMTVANRIGDRTAASAASTALSGDSEEMTTGEVLSTWPFLRDILDLPNVQRPTALATGESPMEETVRLIQQGREREASSRSPIWGPVAPSAHEQAQRGAQSIGDDGFAPTQGRITRHIRSPLATIDSDAEDQADVSVWVIDLTVEPPARERMPRPRPIEPRRRSTEEAERIRAERAAATERIERSRSALRQIQSLRRDLELVRVGRASEVDADEYQEDGAGGTGLTPTRGISAAAASENEVDLMRHLVIDTSSDEEMASTLSDSEGHSTVQVPPQPPKESFDSDIHLWPSIPAFSAIC